MPYIQLSERLWFYVTPNDQTGCWEWTGSKTNTGYGRMSYQKKIVLAHRVAYEVCRGDVGDHFVLHKCDNRLCVNPFHMMLGDHTANMHDMMRKGRARHPSPRPDQTMCKAGLHPWVMENIEVQVTQPHGTKKHSCRVCHAEARARRLGHKRSKYLPHKAGAVVATHSYTPDVQL